MWKGKGSSEVLKADERGREFQKKFNSRNCRDVLPLLPIHILLPFSVFFFTILSNDLKDERPKK